MRQRKQQQQQQQQSSSRAAAEQQQSSSRREVKREDGRRHGNAKTHCHQPGGCDGLTVASIDTLDRDQPNAPMPLNAAKCLANALDARRPFISPDPRLSVRQGIDGKANDQRASPCMGSRIGGPWLIGRIVGAFDWTRSVTNAGGVSVMTDPS